MTIAFIGNPNSGKTTLFNAYTGAHLKVANWPGVTVEKKEGAMRYHGQEYKLVDLPGTYSLTSYSEEEKISRSFILGGDVDVIVNVVDASSLERNLYLTLQLIELGKPVVMALNMMDIVQKRGMEIDLHRLPEMLGIPVIPVSARSRKGLDILIHAAAHHIGEPRRHRFRHISPGGSVVRMARPLSYSPEIEAQLSDVTSELKEKYPDIKNPRWHAIKLLEFDEEITAMYPVSQGLISKNYATDITIQKYNFIEAVVGETLVNKERTSAFTDKVDGILTNRYLGVPIFLAIMAFVFFLTFTVGDWLKGYFELGIEIFSEFADSSLGSLGVNPIVHSLIMDGIIAGIGAILTFLPNIFILFLALAILEDSGYMARVAYVMNGVMGAFGLSGKAFIPMLLGFGCTVPAVMATRALESTKDKKKIMLIIPFMSCSAKLPIYALFSSMFFPENAMLAAYSMYVLGVIVAVVAAFIMKGIDTGVSENLLIIELPEYKIPSAHTVFIYVWEKIKDYLGRAGTVIFIASVFMWLILNFGFSGYVADMRESFGSVFGRYLVPFMAPIGLGFWQVCVALIAGLTAKEVVVASFAVLFGIANLSSADGMNEMRPILASIGFGPLNAYALMTFSLLYVPCLASLATIKREVHSWLELLKVFVFQIGVAWIITFIVYRIGLLII